MTNWNKALPGEPRDVDSNCATQSASKRRRPMATWTDNVPRALICSLSDRLNKAKMGFISHLRVGVRLAAGFGRLRCVLGPNQTVFGFRCVRPESLRIARSSL